MNALAEQVRKRFGAESGNWDGLYQAAAPASIYTENVRVRRLRALALLGGRPGRVLDLGCGSGQVALSIPSAEGRFVFAADFARPMLVAAAGNARRLGSRLGVFAADAAAIPVPAGSFDAILGLGVVEYSPEPERLIQEAVRVLRPGGVLIVSHPNASSPFIRIDDAGKALKNLVTRRLLPMALRRLLKARILHKQDRSYFNHTRHRFDPRRFEAWVESAGLTITERTCHTFGFGILDSASWNARLSGRLERWMADNPSRENFGWTCILKAVKR